MKTLMIQEGIIINKKSSLDGASGYISSHLLPTLVKAGHHVTPLERNSKSFSVEQKLEKMEL